VTGGGKQRRLGGRSAAQSRRPVLECHHACNVAWLLAGDTGEAHLFSAGDRLPAGVEAFPGKEPNDVVLSIENRGAVIAGDTLVDFGQGLEIPLVWLPEGVTREQIAAGLRPLLALPVEHVLATHGGPSDRPALERALS
jgi:glyoxylase-like metal-dependent hydrolase (beta-lactamase superfamily II)